MTAGSSWNDYGITTMIGLTPAICSKAEDYTTGKLLDSETGRGNKYYWVTKFKDGNCWMTQNLDFDDPNSLRRNNGNTTAISGWTDTNNDRQYYDPGEVYQISDVLNVFSAIAAGGWVPTYNENFVTATQFVGTDLQTICSKTADLQYAPTDSPSQCKIYYYGYYDPNYKEHTAVGNYYSWLASTNGTSATSNQNASQSICPSGWKMPFAGSNTGSGSFAGLFNSEDIKSIETLQMSPYYFVLGGSTKASGVNAVGIEGRYNTSTGNSTSGMYSLYFVSSSYTSIQPSSGVNIRYYGMSVRCLVKGS